jgi:hypothetical protein
MKIAIVFKLLLELLFNDPSHVIVVNQYNMIKYDGNQYKITIDSKKPIKIFDMNFNTIKLWKLELDPITHESSSHIYEFK